MEGWETGEERGSGSSRPVGARARSRGLQERATSGRGHERGQPIGVSDLRLQGPPRIWERADGAGRVAGIGSPLFFHQPLVLGDASFKGELDPGTPVRSSYCLPPHSSHGNGTVTGSPSPNVRGLP